MAITFTVGGIPNIVRCGNLHGFAQLDPPALHVAKRYYWATNTETRTIGGRGARMVRVECWINDALFTTRALINDYFESILDPLVGVNGSLTITNGGESQTFANMLFYGFNRTPINDGFTGVPQPIIGGVNISGNYWVPGVLVFEQVSTDNLTGE